MPRNRLLYFNVTVLGKELHLWLKPNRRLISPGASAEWQEDFQEVFREPLQQECVFTGGVSGMPRAAVAISNCDGLLSGACVGSNEGMHEFAYGST
ncbi:UNVERIFIED_CONTAM: A disintegrin and metalloproteinase with thrombospondin motifs 14 [Gekko kuhli]